MDLYVGDGAEVVIKLESNWLPAWAFVLTKIPL